MALAEGMYNDARISLKIPTETETHTQYSKPIYLYGVAMMMIVMMIVMMMVMMMKWFMDV